MMGEEAAMSFVGTTGVCVCKAAAGLASRHGTQEWWWRRTLQCDLFDAGLRRSPRRPTGWHGATRSQGGLAIYLDPGLAADLSKPILVEDLKQRVKLRSKDTARASGGRAWGLRRARPTMAMQWP